MRWWPLIPAGLLISCQASSFTCTSDESCGDGQCEPNGYCSFADEACDSGRRFGEFAGDGVAGQCVGEEDSATDGMTTGGPSPSPSSTATLTSPLTSSGTSDATTGTSTSDPATTTTDPSTTEPPTTEPSSTTDPPLECPEDNWWNCEFPSRAQLGFAAVPAENPLVDFIVLVDLDPERFPGLAENPHDVRFIDDDGATELPHELEWSGDGDRWFAWVRVPEVSTEVNDFIWLYYGSGAPPTDTAAGVVWGTEHTAVLHMGEELNDSSPLSHVTQDLGTAIESGLVGQARRIGDLGGVELDAAEELDQLFVDGGTISAWIQPDGWGGNDYGRIVGHSSNTPTPDGYALYVGTDGNTTDNVRFAHGFESAQSESETLDGSIALGEWHHIFVVFVAEEGVEATVYINGQEVPHVTPRTGSGAPRFAPAATIMIGNHPGGLNRTFDGVIDEVRFSTRPKSSARINAEYLSESLQFLDVGEVETWTR